MRRKIGEQDVETLRSQALDMVDIAAGEVRSQFVSKGDFISEEYRSTLEAVRAWRTNGSDANNIPDEIKSGAMYTDITYEQSAVEIEQTDALYTQCLAQIRAVRLSAKRSIKSGTSTQAIAKSRAEGITALQNIEMAI